jgi:hypothetical protein
MCVTTLRTSTLCGHLTKDTELCKEKTGRSAFKIFYPKCTPTTNRTFLYEICHGCRKYWQAYGIDEVQATEHTQACRGQHGYIGLVSPFASFHGQTPFLMQDIDLNSNDETRNRPKSGVYGVHQVSRTDTKMREYAVNQTRRDVALSDHPSFISTLTLWPRVPGTDCHNGR